LLDPDHAVMRPLFEESNRLYDDLAERSGIDVSLDREPVGTLFVATDEGQLEQLASGAFGQGELLDRGGVLEAEPAPHPTVSGGLRLPGGRRSDPAALTAAAAELARRSGAQVRTGVDVKRLAPGYALTDAGVERARAIVLASGAWTRPLARTA